MANLPNETLHESPRRHDPEPEADRAVADVDLGAIYALERPSRALLAYYAAFSLLFGPLFPFVFVPLFLRYRTLCYRFDDEGIAVRWGALRRREVNLAYRRIQDIHLTSNAIERWLDLARIQVQTASGSHGAEVTIEGVKAFEALRSFLVERMRSERDGDRREAGGGSPGADDAALLEVAVSLGEVRDALRALRAELAGRQRGGEEGEP